MNVKTLYANNRIAFPVGIVLAVLGHLFLYTTHAMALMYVPWVCCLIAMLFHYGDPKPLMVKSGLRAMVTALLALVVYITYVLATR
ncbi:hypothetical protein [Nissabacter sp. SGAir0207]|uniref:hypothetical protein n=1 Tax=Nissabacter sp. SGAir0207 TaxID=2126321 RepID=UPI0010CCF759|nr:hypothetical protein [Nissabacter sp. SGAir0207]QCR38911.1 hypothetical protein C1N62_22640 [Nissabacter sp. SGAir0207]